MRFFYLFIFIVSYIGIPINLLADLRGYGKYESPATPLFMPWKTDKQFTKVEYYLIYALLKNCLHLNGDVIEFGTYYGSSAHIIALCINDISKFDKLFITIDSFEGFPELNSKFDINAVTGKPFFKKGGHSKIDFEKVKRRLVSSDKCNIKVIKGFIPEVLDKLPDLKYCFAHIDVDLYDSTKDSLSYIYEKIVPGGIILFDDYGYVMCKGAKDAIDQFLRDKEEFLIPLQTGQCFLIKK